MFQLLLTPCGLSGFPHCGIDFTDTRTELCTQVSKSVMGHTKVAQPILWGKCCLYHMLPPMPTPLSHPGFHTGFFVGEGNKRSRKANT